MTIPQLGTKQGKPSTPYPQGTRGPDVDRSWTEVKSRENENEAGAQRGRPERNTLKLEKQAAMRA